MNEKDHTDSPSAPSKAHFEGLKRKIRAFEETGLKPHSVVKVFPLLGFVPESKAETGACLCRGISCGRLKVAGKKYTLWDDFLVEGRCGGRQEMTLGDLFEYIKEKSNLNVCGLFYGPAILYNGHKERLKKRVSEVVKEVTKEDIPPHKKMLELIPSFSEDEDCELVPTIRYLYL